MAKRKAAILPADLGTVVPLTYLPSIHCFVQAKVDIYTSAGSIPVAGPKRISGASCVLTGSWMAGRRQCVQASDGYTHIMLVDPQLDVRDAYRGNGLALGGNPDFVTTTGETPDGAFSPWRLVIFTYRCTIPGLGVKKVVLLDQRNSYPSTTLLKDTFTDASGTTLINHIMDAGPTYQTGSASLKINASNQCDVATAGVGGRAASDSGQSDFSSAAVDVLAVKTAGGSGLSLRATDGNNGIDIRLTTAALQIIKRQAGVESVLATTALALVAGTPHTIQATASGTQITANVDGGSSISATSSFNQTTTTHGLTIQPDGGGNTSPLDNFLLLQ